VVKTCFFKRALLVPWALCYQKVLFFIPQTLLVLTTVSLTVAALILPTRGEKVRILNVGLLNLY